MAEEIVIDFLNWQTMVLELIIGGSIAGWFFWRQKQQGDKIESLVSEIKKFEEKQQKLIDENEKAKKLRKKTALMRIEVLLTHLWSETRYHEALISKYYGGELPKGWSDKDLSEVETTEKWIKMIKEQARQIGEDLRNWTLTSYDLLDSELLYALQCIYNYAVKPFMFDKEQPQWDIMDCRDQLDWLEPTLIKYFNHDKNEIGMIGSSTGFKE